ncbi:MAG: hypothetical protein KF774_00185 [Planctomyces sp.]|nr:hypothetical protein [Planctomyces sp.]
MSALIQSSAARIVLVLAALSVLALPASRAEEAPPTDPVADVAAADLDVSAVPDVIEQLGSGARRDRELAERRLLDAGPRILPALPNAEQVDPAARDALNRVRTALERQAGIDAAQPSRVTLAGEHALSEIVAALAAQTRNPISVDPGVEDARVDVRWEGTPFWDCVSELQDRLRLDLAASAAEPELRLVSNADAAPRTVGVRWTAGPVRIESRDAASKPSLVDASRTLVQVRWTLRIEPRLRPLYLTLADADTSLDVDGLAVPPFTPGARRELPVDRWRGCDLDSSFNAPDSTSGPALFNAKGVVRAAALPLRMAFTGFSGRRISVDRRGGVTALLQNVRFDSAARRLSVHLAVTYGQGGPEFESHRIWIHQNAAWLEHLGTGAVVPASEIDLLRSAPAGGTLAYTFEALPGVPSDYRLLYEAPSLIVDVPFEFTGLPISVRDDR